MDFEGGGGGLAIVAGCVIKSAGTFISSTTPVVLYQFRSGGGREDGGMKESLIPMQSSSLSYT